MTSWELCDALDRVCADKAGPSNEQKAAEIMGHLAGLPLTFATIAGGVQVKFSGRRGEQVRVYITRNHRDLYDVVWGVVRGDLQVVHGRDFDVEGSCLREMFCLEET